MRSKKLPNVLTKKRAEGDFDPAQPALRDRAEEPHADEADADHRAPPVRGNRAEVERFKPDLDKLAVIEDKGGKDRILWMVEEDLELLRSWRKRQVEEAGRKLEFVFTSKSAGTLGNRLDNRYVQGMVRRYAKKARIHKKVSPYNFRYTFASNLYGETKNLRLVQKALPRQSSRHHIHPHS